MVNLGHVDHPKGTWLFAALQPKDTSQDPLAGEFFRDDALDSLVREAIQNSLDAQAGTEKVRFKVRFYDGKQAAPRERVLQYFEGLEAHLAGCDPPMSLPSGDVPYIIIEDSQTIGLTGDPTAWDSHDDKNNFYWFWRNVGRSGKKSGSKGSWGVGKWTFPGTSQIRAFFGLSLTNEDRTPRLMGQAVLKVHRVGDIGYHAWGFFASEAANGLQIPIADQAAVTQFMRDFRVERNSNNPGLTVVIPWPTVDFDRYRLARTIAKNYFLPILQDDLVVEVHHGNDRERLSAETVARFADSPEMIELTRYALDCLDHPDTMRAIHVTSLESLTTLHDPALDELAGAIMAGRVAVRITVPLQRIGEQPESSYFDIFLERPEDIDEAEVCWVRDGITIPKVGEGHWRVRHGVRALLVVEDQLLAAIMRDAEGPAHEKWNGNEPRVKDNWANGAQVVRFVGRAVRELAERLAAPPDDIDIRDLLVDLFSINNAGSSAHPDRRRGPREPVNPPAPKPRRFRVDKLADGISLRLLDSEVLEGRLEVAYDTRRGNPFTRHTVYDFDLRDDGLFVTIIGGQITQRSANAISFKVDSTEQFELTITGFDQSRDIITKANIVQ